MGIIIDRSGLPALRKRADGDGSTIVFTNGCFDFLHAGHMNLFEDCRAHGEILVIGLNSDESVRRLKGKGRPVNAVDDRAKILCALIAVDHVCIFGEDTPYEIIGLLRPDVLIKGGDWKIEDIVGRDIVEGRGGRVLNCPYLQGYSTTELIRRIASLSP